VYSGSFLRAHYLMRRPPRKRSTPAKPPSPTGETVARAAVLPRRADSSGGAGGPGGHEPVALLGEIGGGGATYLVRDRIGGDLAVARLLKRKKGDTGGRPIVAMLRELDGSVPAPGAPCPSCGAALTAWAQRCAKCGARLANQAAVTRLVAEQGARYQMIGTLPVYGGGAVSFARRTEDRAVVALHAREWLDAQGGADHLVLVEAGPLAAPPIDVLPTPQVAMEAVPSATPTSLPAPVSDVAPAPASPTEPAPPAATESEALDDEVPMAELPTDVIQTVTREGQGQLHEPTRWMRASQLGSGAIARQSMPVEGLAVPKVCPMCGTEYETDARFCPKDGSTLRAKGGVDPIIDQVIADRYHILKRIGEGGMGRVYLAEHVRMGRMCAIKVMRSALLNDDEAMARFAREASNAARILHPNVATVFDYGETEGLIYLVMELVEGEPLSAIIGRERALPVARVLDLTKQVADALIAAHEMGVVHRDLKPDNILITKRGDREVAKVVDFGIAKAVAESPHEALTRSGLVIGTPEFMSPEQLLGDPVDARTDLYSLGCIVFLMLTGTQAAEAPTREAMLKRRLHELPPHPRAVNRALPPDLDAIVVRLLSSSPADRYPSASELRAALERVRVDGADATPVVGAPVQATPGGSLRFDTPSPVARPRTRRRTWGVVGVGAALGLASVYLLSRQATTETPPATAAAARDSSRIDSAGLIRPPVTGAPITQPPAPGATLPPGSPQVVGPGAMVTRPAPGPVVRIDTPAVTPARPSNSNAGLYAPLNAYARALADEDLGGARQVYAGMTQRQADRLSQLFRDYEVVSAQILTPEATALPTENAEVRFKLVMRMRDRRSGEVVTSRQDYRGRLARRGTGWVLQELST